LVEHFKSPFGPGDFVSVRAIDNQKFFVEMLQRARAHRFYSHPFMSTIAEGTPPRDVISFVLTSFYKIVSPFTGLLCSLGGRAPDLRSRFALMDNIYEEMGCGDLNAAHPSLYLRMLASIGVSASAAESARTLPPIRRINDHLRDVVERGGFAVACAVLASAEATIPPSFPVLATLADRAFPELDTTFFDRHGPRDDGHSDDAAMLFALTASSSDYATVEAEVELDLDFRAELFDEWMQAMTKGVPSRPGVSERPRFASERPARMPSTRPGAHRPSVPPPG
jgi:pyrroloquinoline quinone (PQQ) biosynthesis protein C